MAGPGPYSPAVSQIMMDISNMDFLCAKLSQMSQRWWHNLASVAASARWEWGTSLPTTRPRSRCTSWSTSRTRRRPARAAARRAARGRVASWWGSSASPRRPRTPGWKPSTVKSSSWEVRPKIFPLPTKCSFYEYSQYNKHLCNPHRVWTWNIVSVAGERYLWGWVVAGAGWQHLGKGIKIVTCHLSYPVSCHKNIKCRATQDQSSPQ